MVVLVVAGGFVPCLKNLSRKSKVLHLDALSHAFRKLRLTLDASVKKQCANKIL